MAERIDIDLKDLRCPMPIVELNRVFKPLGSGVEVTVTATDPAFGPDVESWCRRTGHELVSIERDDDVIVAILRKS